MISKWNYLPLTTEEQKLETELASRYANCPPISELLVQRGISSVEEAERFFHPSLKNMHDPFLMPDMDKAVNRLNRAMGSKEKILVFGDYDVDGSINTFRISTPTLSITYPLVTMKGMEFQSGLLTRPPLRGSSSL